MMDHGSDYDYVVHEGFVPVEETNTANADPTELQDTTTLKDGVNMAQISFVLEKKSDRAHYNLLEFLANSSWWFGELPNLREGQLAGVSNRTLTHQPKQGSVTKRVQQAQDTQQYDYMHNQRVQAVTAQSATIMKHLMYYARAPLHAPSPTDYLTTADRQWYAGSHLIRFLQGDINFLVTIHPQIIAIMNESAGSKFKDNKHVRTYYTLIGSLAEHLQEPMPLDKLLDLLPKPEPRLRNSASQTVLRGRQAAFLDKIDRPRSQRRLNIEYEAALVLGTYNLLRKHFYA